MKENLKCVFLMIVVIVYQLSKVIFFLIVFPIWYVFSKIKYFLFCWIPYEVKWYFLLREGRKYAKKKESEARKKEMEDKKPVIYAMQR